MAVVKCEKCGQYYNDGQYSSCQSCGALPENSEPESAEETQFLNQDSASSSGNLGKYASSDTPEETSDSLEVDDDEATVTLNAIEGLEDDPDDQVTVALVKKEWPKTQVTWSIAHTFGPGIFSSTWSTQ